MKRYRADFFDRDFNFVDMAQTSNPTLIFDYLVLEKSSCQFPKKMNVAKGNYVAIRGDDVLYYGVVVDFSYDGKISTVTFEQLRKLLDVEVFADADQLSSMSIEQWLASMLRTVYQGTDIYQNLSGMSITINSSTMGSYQYSDDGIYNIYDLVVHFFKVYGVILDITLDITNKEIDFAFRTISNVVWKIETSIADVLDYSIKASTDQEYPSKILYENEQDRTQSITYYWHPTEFSGTIDTDGTTNRVVPVISRCKIVAPVEQTEQQQAKTFEQVAYEDAYQSMYQSKYDDQIEIMFNTDSKLLEVGRIGQLYRVIDDDNQYPTILTGYQRLNDKHTLMTFGFVRSRFTQIFKIERRK